jgi:hypothetical protein
MGSGIARMKKPSRGGAGRDQGASKIQAKKPEALNAQFRLHKNQ